jgi:histidine ammonia-lyase
MDSTSSSGIRRSLRSSGTDGGSAWCVGDQHWQAEAEMTTVTIAVEPMTLDDLVAIVEGAQVGLDDAVLARIASARAVVDHALATNAAVYGLTTGVGHDRDTRLTEEEIRSQQLFLIMSHSGGVGPPLPMPLVRAALAVRLNGLARGGSGASPAAAEVLVAMLNHQVHPIVPGIGSVGAGDLSPLAGMAQVAVGRGRADSRGEIVPGGEALARAAIEPLVPSGKDGLALISSNAVSIGYAALVVTRARRVARTCDVAAALSMEALEANPSVLHPVAAGAKAIAGQSAAAAHLRWLLEGGSLVDPGSAHSVQDALSIRVVPQVHGALRHYVDALEQAVVQELNAQSDNPLVVLADQSLISNGNFHPMVLAIAADALRIAVTHVGQLCERRMAHLWERFFVRFERGQPLHALAGLSLRYPAAALYSELRQLAAPATLDTPSLDLGVEDHSTAAPLTVRLTDRSLDLLEDLLTIEVLMARDVLSLAGDSRPRLGRGTGVAMEVVGKAVDVGGAPEEVHLRVKEQLVELAEREHSDSSG